MEARAETARQFYISDTRLAMADWEMGNFAGFGELLERLQELLVSLEREISADRAGLSQAAIEIINSSTYRISIRISACDAPLERVRRRCPDREALEVATELSMSKGHTIALSLYDEHIAVLDQLARRQGSRSGAAQRLLEEVKRREIYRELDEAYQELSNAGGMRSDRQLAAEMLSAVSWPQEWQEGGKGGKRQMKRPRSKGGKAK